MHALEKLFGMLKISKSIVQEPSCFYNLWIQTNNLHRYTKESEISRIMTLLHFLTTIHQ